MEGEMLVGFDTGAGTQERKIKGRRQIRDHLKYPENILRGAFDLVINHSFNEK